MFSHWRTFHSKRAGLECVGLLLLCLFTIAGSTAKAQDSTNVFDDVDPSLADAAYLGLILPIDLGFRLVNQPPPVDGDPWAVDEAARNALVWEHPESAALASDVFLYALNGVALGAPIVFNGSTADDALAGTLVGVEALATTGFLTTLFKHLAGRQRPYAYYGGLDGGYNSFFSGHTSTTFASATLLTIFAYEYEWLSDDTRWIVPTTSYLIAGFTGYLRMAGDRHWLTDVLIGAAAGISSSYLVFALRTSD